MGISPGLAHILRSKFSPASLRPNLWIDPSDITTLWQDIAGTSRVSSTTQTVGKADDKSGKDFHLTAPGDDTTRPTYNTTDFPHILFDGSNDYLRRAATLGMAAAGAVSIYAAIKPNPGLSMDFISEDSSSSVSPFYRITQSQAADANDLTAIARDDASGIWTNLNNQLLGDEIYDNTNKVIGLIDSGSNIKLYSNGTEIISHNFTRGNTPTTDQFQLMARKTTGTGAGWFAGRIYGLVIVNRVVIATERARLTTWLGNKIGLSI